MPIGQYISWVGAVLLALLFVADWCSPRTLPESGIIDAANRPTIRITSMQQLPERIIFDTNQPTIVVPPPVLVTVAPEPDQSLQSYASAAPHLPTVNVVEQKKRQMGEPQKTKVAPYQRPLANTPVAAAGRSVTAVPLTRLSLIDFISRNILRLN
jgi:hypothetical protein